MSVDGERVAQAQLHWRGSLAIIEWKEPEIRNGWQRRVFWPDTLDAAGRRELRLAAGHGRIPVQPASVAP